MKKCDVCLFFVTLVSFSIDPQDFPLGIHLYQKLPFLAILRAVSPHFSSHNGEIWREGADL